MYGHVRQKLVFGLILLWLTAGSAFDRPTAGQVGSGPAASPAQPAAAPTGLAQQGKEAESKPPEALLSANSILFLRYDGFEPHKQAYARTTLAKIMKDDLGEFLDYLGTYMRDGSLSLLLKRGEEAKPANNDKAVAATQKFMEYFWRHGVAIGLEVTDASHVNAPRRGRLLAPEVPDFQATIVFPEGGRPANRPAVFAFLKLLAEMGGLEVIEKKEGPRHFFTTNDRVVTWWQEGDHAVLRIGTAPLKTAIDVIEGRRANVASTPLFKSVAEFKSYETDVRGLVDLDKLMELVREPGEHARQLDMILDALTRHLLLHQIGANGVKGLSFHMGFSGKYQRSTVMLHVVEPAERSGLLRALTTPSPLPLSPSGERGRGEGAGQAKDLDPANFPAMPHDAACVQAMHVDWLSLYDYASQTAKLVALADALPRGQAPQNRFNLDGILGVDFRKDVLACLESTVVAWNAHSEGPFYLGQGVAIKVKDVKKLQQSLTILSKVLNDGGFGLRLQKRVYRGVDVYVLNPGPGPNAIPSPVAPTYALHKGWLVIGVFPQAVKGYILRSEGDRKKWQPPPYYQELLAQSLKEGNPNSRLAGVGVIDPAPTFEIGLALMPIFAGTINAVARGSVPPFDVSKIPNAQAVNEFVYPTVTFFFDDGTTLRWENHFAIDFPTDFLAVPLLGGLVAELVLGL